MSTPFVNPNVEDDDHDVELSRDGRRKPRRVPQTAEEQNTIIPHGWRPTAAAPVPVVRCTAIKSNGERCKQWSIRGTTICYAHGGRLNNVSEHAAAVVEAARLRLIGLTDAAVNQIEDLMENASAEAIRLKAAQDVLDRAGVRGAIEVEVTHTAEQSAVDRVNERLARISQRINPTPIEPADEDEAIDAEIIEETEERDGS